MATWSSDQTEEVRLLSPWDRGEVGPALGGVVPAVGHIPSHESVLLGGRAEPWGSDPWVCPAI